MTSPWSWHRNRPAWAVVDKERLVDFSRRSQQALLLAGVTGVLTGLVVAAFERITAELMLGTLFDLPFAVQVGAPALGLLLATLFLRLGGRDTTPATSDAYIRAFHDRHARLDLRRVPARLLAAIATLGLGAPLGYEGPALYAGAAIGSNLQRRLRGVFTVEDSKLLLVAGAAAGVAAIFKAPVTGLIFALEVPYQQDLARRMLLPAAISAAASYVTFAAIAGTEPLLPIAGRPPFNLVDLGGAAVVGLLCGGLARVFIMVVRWAKTWSVKTNPLIRVAVCGAVIAGTVVAAHGMGGTELALGPGYGALRWALDPDRSVVAIIALGTLRVVGMTAAIGGGGTGGLFIPLVIQGALVGRAVGGIFEPDTSTLFPVVGMAAFLGAGYRVPLAAVVFVAEFTGRPGFVVPGLIAAVVAQLVMGRRSVSPYQVSGRVGHLEERLHLPLAAVVDTDVRTAPPDATIEELFWQHFVGTRRQSVAVVDGNTYLGLARAADLGQVERDAWSTTAVTEILRRDVPTAAPSWLLRDAMKAMERADVDRLAVCEGDQFVGMINASDLLALDELLDRTEGGT